MNRKTKKMPSLDDFYKQIEKRYELPPLWFDPLTARYIQREKIRARILVLPPGEQVVTTELARNAGKAFVGILKHVGQTW